MRLFEIKNKLTIFPTRDKIFTVYKKRTHEIMEQRLEGNLYTKSATGITNETIVENLNKLLEDITIEHGYKIKAVDFIVPDPEITVAIKTYTDLPVAQQDYLETVKSAIDNDYKLHPEEYVFHIERYRTEDKTHLVHVFFASSILINSVIHWAASKGIVLRSIRPANQYIHNAVLNHISPAHTMLFYIGEFYWTLSLLDSKHRLLYCKSKWNQDEAHDSPGNNSDMAAEMLDSVLVNVKGIMSTMDKSLSVNAYYLCTKEIETQTKSCINTANFDNVINLHDFLKKGNASVKTQCNNYLNPIMYI